MLRHCQLRVLTTCKTCDEWPVKRGNEEAGSNTLSGGGLSRLRDPRACKLKHEREDSCCAVRQHFLHYRGECPEDDVRNDVSTHVGDEIPCANNFNPTHYSAIKPPPKGIFSSKKVSKRLDTGLWLSRIFFGIFKPKCGGEKGTWSRGSISICTSYFVTHVALSARADEALPRALMPGRRGLFPRKSRVQTRSACHSALLTSIHGSGWHTTGYLVIGYGGEGLSREECHLLSIDVVSSLLALIIQVVLAFRLNIPPDSDTRICV